MIANVMPVETLGIHTIKLRTYLANYDLGSVPEVEQEFTLTVLDPCQVSSLFPVDYELKLVRKETIQRFYKLPTSRQDPSCELPPSITIEPNSNPPEGTYIFNEKEIAINNQYVD